MSPAHCYKIKAQETSLLPLNSSPAPLNCHNTTVNTPPIIFSLIISVAASLFSNGSEVFITLLSRNNPSIHTTVLCNQNGHHSNKFLVASHRLSNSPRNLNVPLFRCSHIPAKGVQSALNSPPLASFGFSRTLSKNRQCGSPTTPADC